MKNFSFSNIVENVFGHNPQQALNQFIRSYVLTIDTKKDFYVEIPKNDLDFGLVVKTPKPDNQIFFLKNGDFKIDRVYNNDYWLRNLVSEKFTYDESKKIPLYSLTDEQANYIERIISDFIHSEIYKYGSSAD